MVLPPWTLVSPKGDVHDVAGAAQLKVLAKANGLIDSSYKDQLRVVVGDGNSKPLERLPRHRQGWQLLQRVQWLAHDFNGEMVPVIGGDGKLFVANFADWCNCNLPGLTGERLNEFLNGGWYWSNGFKEFRLRSVWKLAGAPPGDAVAHIRDFVQGQQQRASGAAAAPIILPNLAAQVEPLEGCHSPMPGSLEVSFRTLEPFSSRPTRWH
jgi:hypothetical protein